MDAVQLRIFILHYYIIIKKKHTPNKIFQIVISGFVATLMRIGHKLRYKKDAYEFSKVLAHLQLQDFSVIHYPRWKNL